MKNKLKSWNFEMSCFNPLFSSTVPGMWTVNGKPYRRVYSVKRFHDSDVGSEYRSGLGYDDYLKSVQRGDDVIPIACGHCIGCRLSYARQWADRCMLEKQYHVDSWFVTLTYNDDHVPRSYYGDLETGEAQPVLTLCRDDVQKFFKRLRKAHPGVTIRYFGCGEYGPNTWRPHYHMILYGLPLTDLVVKRQDLDGSVIAYTSRALSDAWSLRPFGNFSPILEPLGDVECSDVTWSACNYVARYIVKKQLGPDGRDFYETFNIYPPFSMMSSKPGIGRRYYDEHPDLYKFQSIQISTPDGGRSIHPPRYYDKLYDIDHPDEMQEIKEMRRLMAENAQRFKLSQTSLSVPDLEALEERAILSKVPKDFDI